VLVRGKYTSEIVQVELIKSYCLPILIYSLGALAMNASLIQELSVCWNNGFRKKIRLHRWEYVKQLHFCGVLDFKQLHDLQRWRFLTTVCKKVAFLSSFFDAVELEYRYVLLLSDEYLTTSYESFVSAVHERFGGIEFMCICNNCFYFSVFSYFFTAPVANKGIILVEIGRPCFKVFCITVRYRLSLLELLRQ